MTIKFNHEKHMNYIYNTPTYFREFLYEKRIPIIACLLFIGIYYPLNFWCKHTCFWFTLGWNSLTNTGVCELQFIDGVIRQPMSTFTNIFFLFFGVDIISKSVLDYRVNQGHHNMLIANFQYSVMFGMCMLTLFFGSTLYHASVVDIFAQMDMAGVFACALFPLFFTLHKLYAARFYDNKPYFSMMGSALVVLLFFFFQGLLTSYYWEDEMAYYILPMLYFSLIGATGYYNLYYVQRSERTSLFISLICTTCAVFLYFYDWYYCNEMSYFQPHSLWHIFSAFSMYYFYMFLRSEHNVQLRG